MSTQTISPFLSIGQTRLHYRWLRNICQCRECLDQLTSYQVQQRASSSKPLTTEQHDEKLIIDWNENPPHRSIYNIPWLLTYASNFQPESLKNPIVVWDKARLDSNPVAKFDPNTSSQEIWMKQLLKFGFVILTNIATEEFEPFVSSLGELIHTPGYERIESVRIDPNHHSKELFRTGASLALHTDNGYRSYKHRMAQFLYCAENSVSGGESLVVDGFCIAKDLCSKYPDYFKILAETPVQFLRIQHEQEYFYPPTNPIFELDKQDNIIGIRFCERNCLPVLPFEQMESFYKAYEILVYEYLNNPNYQYCFQLKAGDCLVLQNYRVLHGRNAFDFSSGIRELRAAYIEWDLFLARYHYRQFSDLKL